MNTIINGIKSKKSLIAKTLVGAAVVGLGYGLVKAAQRRNALEVYEFDTEETTEELVSK